MTPSEIQVHHCQPARPPPLRRWPHIGHGFSFHEFLSAMNPLQYLPVVGTIYRAVTGDVIPEALRDGGSMLVSGLLGGPIGLITYIATTIAEKITGIDPEKIVASVLNPAPPTVAVSAAPAGMPTADPPPTPITPTQITPAPVTLTGRAHPDHADPDHGRPRSRPPEPVRLDPATARRIRRQLGRLGNLEAREYPGSRCAQHSWSWPGSAARLPPMRPTSPRRSRSRPRLAETGLADTGWTPLGIRRPGARQVRRAVTAKQAPSIPRRRLSPRQTTSPNQDPITPASARCRTSLPAPPAPCPRPASDR